MNEKFKNIPQLVKLEMVSHKNCKIKSMISTFEGCINLEYFSISGFETFQITSLNKLFYNTSLTILIIKDFNARNSKDMSYMFYGCSELKN